MTLSLSWPGSYPSRIPLLYHPLQSRLSWVERAVLSFNSFPSPISSGRELLLRKWPSPHQNSWLQGLGRPGLLRPGLRALTLRGPAYYLAPKQGPDSKAPGINPVPAESRPRFRDLEQASGGKLKGIFYSKKKFWGVAFNSECWFWNGSKSSSRCGSLNQLEESKLSPIKENSENAFNSYYIWASWSRCHSQILKVSEKNDWMLIIPSRNYHNYVIWRRKSILIVLSNDCGYSF